MTKPHLLLASLIVFFSGAVYGQEDLDKFLSRLKNQTPDSSKTLSSSYYSNESIQEKTIIYYSHFSPYQTHDFQRIDSIVMFIRYRKDGSFSQVASLCSGYGSYYGSGYSIKYYDRNGVKRKSTNYWILDHEIFNDPIVHMDHNKIKLEYEYKYNKQGKRIKSEQISFEPSKWLVFDQGDYYKITKEDFTREHTIYPNAYFATLDKKNNDFVIQIFNPRNNTKVSTLNWNTKSNPLISSIDEKVIVSYFDSNIRIIPNEAIIKLDHSNGYEFLSNQFDSIYYAKYGQFKLYKDSNSNNNYLKLCFQKCGLYDFKGSEIIPPVYKSILPYFSYLKAQNGDKEIIFDYSGRKIQIDDQAELMNKDYKTLSTYSNPDKKYWKVYTTYNKHDQAVVSIRVKKKVGWGEYYGILGRNGKEIVPCQYSSYNLMEDGYALKDGVSGKIGLISFDGKILMGFTFDSYSDLYSEIDNPYTEVLTVKLNN